MWHGWHPLLCPVLEETCGCWELLCWSVVPKDGGSRAARRHRDGSVVASVPGWLGQPYRGAFAAVVLAQPALPLLGQPWRSAAPSTSPCGCVGIPKVCSGAPPAGAQPSHHRWCSHRALEAPSLLFGCSLPSLCPQTAFSICLAGGSHQQSPAAPSRLVPGAKQKEGGAARGRMERGQGGHGELGQCEGCPVRCWHGAAGLGRDRDVGKEQRSGTKPGLAGPSRDLCGWLGTVPRRGLGSGHEQQWGLASVRSYKQRCFACGHPQHPWVPEAGGTRGEHLGAAKSRDPLGHPLCASRAAGGGGSLPHSPGLGQ